MGWMTLTIDWFSFAHLSAPGDRRSDSCFSGTGSQLGGIAWECAEVSLETRSTLIFSPLCFLFFSLLSPVEHKLSSEVTFSLRTLGHITECFLSLQFESTEGCLACHCGLVGLWLSVFSFIVSYVQVSNLQSLLSALVMRGHCVSLLKCQKDLSSAVSELIQMGS